MPEHERGVNDRNCLTHLAVGLEVQKWVCRENGVESTEIFAKTRFYKERRLNMLDAVRQCKEPLMSISFRF